MDALSQNDWNETLKKECIDFFNKNKLTHVLEAKGIDDDQQKAVVNLWKKLKDHPKLQKRPDVLQLPDYYHHDFINNIKNS